MINNETARLDVALVYPPWPVLDDRAILQNSLPPLGLLSIASYLESLDYSVRIHDVHGEKLDDVILAERLRAERPRFIGISVLTNMSIPAHAIAKLAREVVPDAVIVMGGVHAEALPERTLRNSAVDYVVRGDGEETMREIVEGRSPRDIQGLSFREEGKVRNNPARRIEMNLDRYPFPAYHLVDFKNYFPAVGSYRNLPAINMLMTRGCPGKCAFCNSARTVLRTRDADAAVAQIKHLNQKYGIRQIQFYDDTFTVMKKNVLKFCKGLEAEKLGVTWTAYIRGDCFSDDMAAAMKAAGCHQVLVGIETGNAEVAARLGKPIDRKKYYEAVKIAHRHGMEVRASFIIGNLGETWQSMVDTLEFAIDLDIDLFQLNISTPYPGTALFNEVKQRGWLRHENWYRYGQGEMLYDQPQMSEAEIRCFEKYAFRRFYMRPRAMLRMLKRVANVRHIRDYVLAATVLLFGIHKKKGRSSWDCWTELREEDFLDLEFSEQPPFRLTYELRQGREFEELEHA